MGELPGNIEYSDKHLISTATFSSGCIFFWYCQKKFVTFIDNHSPSGSVSGYRYKNARHQVPGKKIRLPVDQAYDVCFFADSK